MSETCNFHHSISLQYKGLGVSATNVSDHVLNRPKGSLLEMTGFVVSRTKQFCVADRTAGASVLGGNMLGGLSTCFSKYRS